MHNGPCRSRWLFARPAGSLPSAPCRYIPNGAYAERGLCSPKYFGLRDVLAFTERSCLLGHNIEFGYTQGIGCESVLQEFGHGGFGCSAGYASGHTETQRFLFALRSPRKPLAERAEYALVSSLSRATCWCASFALLTRYSGLPLTGSTLTTS
jgi:hypothetical protein